MALLVFPTPTLEVWSFLCKFDGGVASQLTWDDALRLCTRGSSNAIGELSLDAEMSFADWKGVPIALRLRVVMMRKEGGFSLRWGDPSKMKEILSGNFHDHLLPDAGKFSEVRSGWVKVLSPGQLDIHK